MVVAHKKLKIGALIGFTAICQLIFLALFGAAGGSLSLNSPYTVSALVPNTFNIVPNADVDSAGVKIGSVKSVTPDGQSGRVTFEVTTKNPAFKHIYRDATDQVRTKTLVGESYLSINQGTPNSGAIPDNGTMPVTQNQSAVPLQDVLGMFNPATRRGVEASLQGFGRGLAGHGQALNTLFGELNPTVNSANQLTEILNPERQQLAALIDDSGQVMQALGERTSQFQSLVRDAKTTAVAVAAQAANLKGTLGVLPSTLAAVRGTVAHLGSFSSTATPVFANLRTAATKLSPAIQQLEPTAVAGQHLFAQLQPFLSKFGPLVQALRPGANSLSTIVGPLDAMLRQIDPALAYWASYSREFGNLFSNVGSITNSPDGLGDRGRVFGMVGAVDYTGLNTQENALLNALINTGTFNVLHGTQFNAYPMPGTAGTPNSIVNYHMVKEMP